MVTTLPTSVGAIYICCEDTFVYSESLTPLERLQARVLALTRAAGAAVVIITMAELLNLAA